MAALVAGGAAQLQLLDHCVVGDIEVGDVVVLQQRGGTAINAGLIALLRHSLLPGAGVALLGAGVDGAAIGVVDQRADAGLWCNALNRRHGQRTSVVERGGAGTHVHNHFCLYASSSLVE